MKLDEMNRTVGAELEKIPKRTTPHQWELRAFYPAIRLNDLGKNGDPNRTAGDALKDAIDLVLKKHPEARLDYDKEFFGIE